MATSSKRDSSKFIRQDSVTAVSVNQEHLPAMPSKHKRAIVVSPHLCQKKVVVLGHGTKMTAYSKRGVRKFAYPKTRNSLVLFSKRGSRTPTNPCPPDRKPSK